MRRRWVSRISIVVVALILGWIIFLGIGVPVWNEMETQRSAKTNAPPVLVPRTDLQFTTFPDATHVRLRDGRVFRLAYVLAPDQGTPEYAKAVSRVKMVFGSSANLEFGLKPIGLSADGETLVELWGFHRLLGGCGNLSWSERRRAKIPHWQPLTWQLVTLGDFALERGVPDREAVGFERVAREEGNGLWSNPTYLRRFADLDYYASVLGAAKQKHTLWEHRKAAMILVRADPATYAPPLLAIVTDASRDDPIFRSQLAIGMDQAGYGNGTAYLMDALRGTVDAGLDQYDLRSIAMDYAQYWHVAGAQSGDGLSVVAHYDSVIRPNAKR
jgi:hypothetical protein